MASSLKDVSRAEWETTVVVGYDQISAGCLQRIADATELMAKNHGALIDERDRYKRWYEEERARNSALQRRINSYRGTVTRLKRKAK